MAHVDSDYEPTVCDETTTTAVETYVDDKSTYGETCSDASQFADSQTGGTYTCAQASHIQDAYGTTNDAYPFEGSGMLQSEFEPQRAHPHDTAAGGNPNIAQWVARVGSRYILCERRIHVGEGLCLRYTWVT